MTAAMRGRVGVEAFDTHPRRRHPETVRVGVLGPLEVDGGAVTLGRRDRVVLAALAVRPGATVRAEAIAEALWGDDPPASGAKVVQGCIMRLRKSLGAGTIQTSASGYRLALHHDELDHQVLEDLLARARELLHAKEADRSRFLADQALGLWRGEPFAELADWEPGRIEGERLTELYRDAEELRAQAMVEAGEHDGVLADLTRMVREQPTRERRWWLLALAEYHAGRQADALATLRRARSVLVDELGLDPGPELTALEAAVLRQDAILSTVAASPPVSDTCPYPGLLPFEPRDAAAFFGRDADTTACLRRLDESGVLAVVGPSGSGKSSLLRAGVCAALARDGRRVVVTTPLQLRPDESTTTPRRVDVLVVDQAEELLLAPPKQQAAVLELLERFRDGPALVAVGVRADRLADLSPYPVVAGLVENGLHLLGPMSAEDLRQAIEGPAAQAGLRLEDGLVDLLLREVHGEPGALPLLSHVLRETWEVREGRTLTVAGYRSTGGLREAVAQSAEGLFRDLGTSEQALVRDLMTRLVEPGEQGTPVRRRVPRRIIARDEVRHHLVDQFVDARLLTTDGDSVEIAHESLALAWPRLRSWLDDDVDGLRIKRHLSVAADSWDELGRPESELYRGVRLARAREWASRAHPDLTEAEGDFLAASAALAETEQRATEERLAHEQDQLRRERRLNRRLRTVLGAVAALLAVAVLAGTLALTASTRAEKHALSADAQLLGAEALRSPQIDQALLLAVAGLRLEDSTDTRANLLATLDRTRSLLTTARTPNVNGMAVDPTSGRVMVASMDAGLLVRDGSSLASVGRRPDLRARDAVTGVGGRVTAVALLPETDGTGPGDLPTVALVDDRGEPAGDQLGGLPANRHATHDLSISPGGSWLAVTLLDSRGADAPVVGVWDLRAPDTPAALLDLGSQTGSPLVDARGTSLYTTGDGFLRVTDLPSGRARRTISPADLDARGIGDTLALSPDGATLAVATEHEVTLVDTATLRPQAHLPVDGPVGRLAFAPKGRRLAVSGERLIAWDLTGKEPLELLRQDGLGAGIRFDTRGLAFDPSGETLYEGTFDGLLTMWDLTGARRALGTTQVPDAAVSGIPRLSPDGSKVVYLDGDSLTFQFHDVDSGAVTEPTDLGQEQVDWIDASWSPDGTTVTFPTGVNVAAVWDAATGRRLARRELPEGEGVSMAVFSRDGQRLLVGSTTGRLHVLQVPTLTPVRDPIVVAAPEDHPGEIVAVENLASSPDGRTVLVVPLGVPPRLVDVVTGAQRVIEADVFSAAFSPDGERIFVTTRSGQAGLLRATTGRWLSSPDEANDFGGWSVAFSPDGTEAATTAWGRVARWDGRTGAFLGAATFADAGVVTYSSDSRAIHVTGAEGRVHTWRLDPAAWVEAACRLAGRPLSPAEWSSHLPQRAPEPVCAG